MRFCKTSEGCLVFSNLTLFSNFYKTKQILASSYSFWLMIFLYVSLLTHSVLLPPMNVARRGRGGRGGAEDRRIIDAHTGRYSRPFKKPAQRTSPICKIEMEDEYHFLNICPAYQEKRSSFLDYLENEYRIKISRMSPNRIFMFLINPPGGNVRMQKFIAKHIFECFEKSKG